MCDTMVAMPTATKDGRLLFAKNSDRAANEPHLVVRYPAKNYDIKNEPDVKLTYISIPQVEHTYEVVLMKPSWIWGAEMGFNEYGLNIGNEAVFTKEKKGEKSLLGMDMLRLALERTTNAKEAFDYIIELLQVYGQGGNCGFDHEFYYHNSFLIADRKEAYVLETAGKFYVGKKVKDYYAISNCLSIENDYDFIHPEAINNALNKRLCKKAEEFGFAKCYTEKVFTYFAKSKQRMRISSDILEKEKGNITINTMINILRSHAPDYKEDINSVGSICMHAGGMIGDHTTGSYVASLSEEGDYYYVTGSSLPCQSIFKPMLLTKNMPIPDENEEKAKEYWLKQERLQRFIISGQINKTEYLNERDELEQKYIELFQKASAADEKNKVIMESWEKAQALTDKYLEPLKDEDFIFRKGKRSYRRYWAKKTKALFLS